MIYFAEQSTALGKLRGFYAYGRRLETHPRLADARAHGLNRFRATASHTLPQREQVTFGLARAQRQSATTATLFATNIAALRDITDAASTVSTVMRHFKCTSTRSIATAPCRGRDARSHMGGPTTALYFHGSWRCSRTSTGLNWERSHSIPVRATNSSITCARCAVTGLAVPKVLSLESQNSPMC